MNILYTIFNKFFYLINIVKTFLYYIKEKIIQIFTNNKSNNIKVNEASEKEIFSDANIDKSDDYLIELYENNKSLFYKNSQQTSQNPGQVVIYTNNISQENNPLTSIFVNGESSSYIITQEAAFLNERRSFNQVGIKIEETINEVKNFKNEMSRKFDAQSEKMDKLLNFFEEKEKRRKEKKKMRQEATSTNFTDKIDNSKNNNQGHER